MERDAPVPPPEVSGAEDSAATVAKSLFSPRLKAGTTW
jgi:hypothetical protein